MAIIETQLPQVIRNTQFTNTIVVTLEPLEVIDTITITPLDKDSGVDVIDETISGMYLDSFNDTLQYITKGSSDKLEVPVTVNTFNNIPFGKTIISVMQDSKDQVVKSYSVEVVSTLGVFVSVATQVVKNNWGIFGGLLTNYINSN